MTKLEGTRSLPRDGAGHNRKSSEPVGCFWLVGFIWVVILVLSPPAALSEQDVGAISLQTRPHEKAIILVTQTFSQGQIEFVRNDKVVSRQSGVPYRQYAAVFVVNSGAVGDKIHVRAAQKSRLNHPSGIHASLITSPTANELLLAEKLQEGLGRWEKHHYDPLELDNQFALEKTTKLEIELVEDLFAFQLNALYETEKYDACEAYFQQHSTISQSPLIDMARYECVLAGNVTRGQEIEIGVFLKSLDQQVNLPSEVALAREYLRTQLGNKRIFKGVLKRDFALVETGKDDLTTALANAQTIGDVFLQALIFNGLSSYYVVIGDRRQAEALLINSIESHRKVRKTKRLGDSLNNIARLYQRSGKRRKAIAALIEAIEIDHEYPLHSETGFLLLQLAQNYGAIGAFHAASLKYNEAFELFSSKDNRFGVGLSLQGLGVIAMHERKFQIAGNLLKRALEEFVVDSENAFSRHSLLAKADLLRLGAMLRQYDLPPVLSSSTMQSYAKQLWAYSKKEELSGETLDVLLALAEHYVSFEQLNDLREVLHIANKHLDQDEEIGFRRQRVGFASIEAELYYRLSRRDKLNETLGVVDELQASERKELGSSSLSVAFENVVRRAHAIYAAQLHDDHRSGDETAAADLFAFLEKSSARALRLQRNSIQNADRRVAMDISGISESQSAIVDAPDELSQRRALEKSLTVQLKSLVSRPAMNLSEEPVKGFSLKQAQKKIQDKQLFVRYYLSDFRSFAFFIDNQKIDIVTIENSPQLVDQIEKFVESIENKKNNLSHESGYRLAKLLGLAKGRLANYDSLVYLADGALSRLPFDALNVNEKEKRQRLIDLVGVTSVYSFSEFLGEGLPQGRGQAHDIAVVGDPVFSTGPYNQSSLVYPAGKYQLEPLLRSWKAGLERLPGTNLEAHSIKRLYRDKQVVLALGQNATKKKLLSEPFRYSKVLHVATHGYFNERVPNIVGIAMTPDDSPGSGFLSLEEMLLYEYRANLVVISGCETNQGVVYGSEGMNSLSRGFIASGAGAVLATHWKVPDIPTSKFMRLFYMKLKENGGDAVNALRGAKIEFSSSGPYRHPYYWASFVLSANHFDSVRRVFR